MRLIFLIVVLCSCSPKGYHFKNGDLGGVRYKKDYRIRPYLIGGVVVYFVIQSVKNGSISN